MSEYVPFCFTFHVSHLIARLSKTIHQHIFSCLVGAQYTDCIICLTNTHFVWICTNYLNFASLLISMSLNRSVCAVFPMFHIFPSQRTLTAPAGQTWTAAQKGQPHHLHLQRAALAVLASTHSCLSHSSPLNPCSPVQSSSQLK